MGRWVSGTWNGVVISVVSHSWRVIIKVNNEFFEKYGEVYFCEGLVLETIGGSWEEDMVWRIRVDVEFSPKYGEEEGVEFERGCDWKLCREG